MRRLKTSLFLAIIASALCAPRARAWWVSPTGNDTTGDGSYATPWKTWTKAFLQGGSTTYICKGVAGSTITASDVGLIDNPPNGTTGTPTIVKAENDGIWINGGGSASPITIHGSTQKEYIQIEGFSAFNGGENPAVNVDSPDGTALASENRFITLNRVHAKGNILHSNNNIVNFARVSTCTAYDLAVWGDGRYAVGMYGCSYCRISTATIRLDNNWDGSSAIPSDPKFLLSVYNSFKCLTENVIFLDKLVNSQGGDQGTVYIAGNNNGTTAPYTHSSSNTFWNLISVNCLGNGYESEGATSDFNSGNTFTDVLMFGDDTAGTWGMDVPSRATGETFNHATIVNKNTGGYAGVSVSLTNSLIWSNTGDGLNGSWTNDYCNVTGNGTNYNGVVAGAHNIGSTPILYYRLRLDGTSPGKGVASDGGDMGADNTLLYSNGTKTATVAFPWSGQSRIRNEFCDGSRSDGWCAQSSTVTLTMYVAGSATPWDTADTSSPTAPGSVAVTVNSSSQITVTSTGAVDDVSVASYRLDVATDAGFTSYVSGYQDKTVDSTLSYAVTGLSASTQYFARMRAVDASGNTSVNSSTANGTTQAPASPAAGRGASGSYSIRGNATVRP